MTTTLAPEVPISLTPDLALDGRNGSEPMPSAIFERAVCLALTLRKIGNRKKLPNSIVEVDADKKLISANKKLLDSKELKKIQSFDNQVSRYLANTGLPSLFKGGVYLVPITLVEEVQATLNAFVREREQLVDAFIAAYPSLVEAAPKRLRAAFNATDYPPAQAVRQQFVMEWQYVAFSVPGQLQAISRELFQKEQQKIEHQWQQVVEDVRLLLRANLTDLVNHLVDRLQPGADGKPKRFYATAVTNLTQFLDTFAVRNLTDDHELARVVTRARELLEGVEPETVRKSDDLRATLRTSFSQLKETLSTLIVTRPTRVFSFTEE